MPLEYKQVANMHKNKESTLKMKANKRPIEHVSVANFFYRFLVDSVNKQNMNA